MTRSTSDRPGEFALIRDIFAPLSGGGAFELSDDAALLSPQDGKEFVLTADAIVEAVHFRKGDPPETIARKLLRVSLSDLAAKGAAAQSWLMTLALPEWPDGNWLERFAKGLAQDQAIYGIALMGGDTVSIRGPLVLSATMIGSVPQGTMVRRKGAAPDELVFVTGTIGDAGGGLEILSADEGTQEDWQTELIERYQVPQPRVSFGQGLRGIATSALDVSDGLIADLQHIADVSKVKVEVQLEEIPLSTALVRLWGDGEPARVKAATSGDDYEIAFTAKASSEGAIQELAQRTRTRVGRIGRVTEGSGVQFVAADGRRIALDRKGYAHF